MTDFLHSRYRLVEILGQGAMGVVWQAHDSVLQRDIAIKELRAVPGVDPVEALERFLVEARAAARLSHPNIVAIHDVFRESDRVVIAMELVVGPTLDQVVATSGAQSPATVRAIMAQVAQALAVAHGGGVVHRDLKPDNIFWTLEGRAVVADFGLARIGAGRGTVEGTVMGTPGYMAPEQVRGVVAGPATDVFGWGAVAYELASGRPPFGDPAGTDPAALAYRVVHEDPPPLSLPADPALAALISRTLAKDPTRRPADGGQLVAAMGAPAPPAAPPARARRVSSPQPRRRSSPAVGPQSPQPARPTTRGRPLAIVLGVMGVSVVLATAGLVAAGSAGERTTTTSVAPTRPTMTTLASQDFPTYPGKELLPGVYFTSVFKPVTSMRLQEGWKTSLAEFPGYLELAWKQAPTSVLSVARVSRVLDPAWAYSKPPTPVGSQAAPRDLVAWFKAHERLDTGVPKQVSVGRVSGFVLEVEVTRGYDYVRSSCPNPCVLLFDAASGWFSLSAQKENRVYILEVNEQPIVITIEAPADRFEEFRAQAESVIATITFGST